MPLKQLVGAVCLGALQFVPVAGAFGDDCHDDFAHLVDINEASLVMLRDEELLTGDLAARIAVGVRQIEQEQAEAGSRRSANYLVFEARPLEAPAGLLALAADQVETVILAYTYGVQAQPG